MYTCSICACKQNIITYSADYAHINILKILVVVALLFYVHGKHLISCRDGQLT